MTNKTKMAKSAAATALLAVTGLAVAPLASADDLTIINERITVLEQGGSTSAYNAEEVARLNSRLETLEQQEAAKALSDGGNMVTFRGGYARNNTNRRGDILTDLAGTAGQSNGKADGWYVGASLDMVLSDDFFGAEDSIEVLGEIMFEYKEFQSKNLAIAPLPTLANTALTGLTNDGGFTSLSTGSNRVTVGQFTLTASPKIKFMKGSKFRPWIIPVGLAIHVISPPSDGVTVLKPGMHFGAGADYNVWNNIYVGADIRYDLTFGTLDGVNPQGLTTGGYVGFGF